MPANDHPGAIARPGGAHHLVYKIWRQAIAKRAQAPPWKLTIFKDRVCETGSASFVLFLISLLEILSEL